MLEPEPEPEIQNNVPSSDYDQMSFPQHNNTTGIESYVGMSECGTPHVPITVFEDQSTENGYYPVFQDSHHLTFTVAPEWEPVIPNNIACSDCYQEWFLPYNNTTCIETDMEVIPSPEYGTSLVPIPVLDIEDDRTLTRVLETNQEQVKQSTQDDQDIISETTFHGAQTSIVPEPVKQTTELEKIMMNDEEVRNEDTSPTSDFTTWLNNFMPLEEDNKDNAVDYDLPLDHKQFPPLYYDYLMSDAFIRNSF
ncbi:hypothetical protein M5689_024042 [Euphorbia peplus]|nr:hypothetical protein M5689_024042 [Euphorbia peplus]